MNTKILLIDDDKNITILLSKCLNKFGFEVITTNTSSTSALLVQRHDPGTVILDLMMPEMDGWQVCREIRKFSRVPILIYSAMGDFHTMSSILDAGADYFLIKPASVNTLIVHIKYAIRCSEQQKTPNISKGINYTAMEHAPEPSLII